MVSVESLACPTAGQLPESAWQGLFAGYRALVTDTTEAPDSYHYAVFATVLGATLGRRLWVNYGHPVFPNLYACLVGTTSHARKGTAWRRGHTLLNKLHCADGDTPEESALQVVPGIGSAEGLLDVLNGKRKVVVVAEEEFSSLLGKAKQEALSNLIPKLTSLFDCHDLETLQTRHKKVTALEPFVSIVTGTTPEWLEKYLSRDDIHGGFANRFIYVSGEPKPPKPYPDPVHTQRQAQLVQSMNDIRAWAQHLNESSCQGELVASEAAKTLFEDYYRENYEASKHEALAAVLTRRMPLYVWKLALLYAACERSEGIEPCHVEPAIAVARCLERSVQTIFAEFGTSKTRKLENRFKALLKEAGGAMTSRDLYRKLGITAAYCNTIGASLVQAGEVKREPFHSAGRDVSGYALVPERRDQ